MTDKLKTYELRLVTHATEQEALLLARKLAKASWNHDVIVVDNDTGCGVARAWSDGTVERIEE
jgi:hypothetical protein